jgi:hypothetical protein
MQIRLWYNKDMGQWRWSLIDHQLHQESGQQPVLRDAMGDIANTVEYLTDKYDDTEMAQELERRVQGYESTQCIPD